MEGIYRKLLNLRYGYPTRGIKIIAVAGSIGKSTTARLIHAILEREGIKSTLIDDTHDISASRWFSLLSGAKSQKSEFVVAEVTKSMLARNLLTDASIELIIISGRPDGEKNDGRADLENLLSNGANFSALDRDDRWFDALQKYPAKNDTISFGWHDESEAEIKDVKLYRHGLEVNLVIDHQTKLDLASYLVGRGNAKSIAAAATAAYILKLNIDNVKEGIADLEDMSGNFQYIEPEKGYETIVDRAPNDQAVEQIVDSAKELCKSRLLIAVSTPLKQYTLEKLSKMSARLFVVNAQDKLPNTAENVDSVGIALAKVHSAALGGDTVLLLGKDFATHETDRSN